MEIEKKENFEPKYLEYLTDLTKDAYSHSYFDNAFTVFKTINNLLYLIYVNIYNSIVCYDLNNNQKINEIKSNQTYIKNFRHQTDINNKRDLLISISNNNIKLWNVNNCECILDLQDIYNDDNINSACFLNDNSQIYIVVCGSNFPKEPEPIKVFDFHGRNIKEINNSNDSKIFIDTYYSNEYLENYIIVGCKGFAKSYNYNKNMLYHIYSNFNEHSVISIVIINDDNIEKLIESSQDRNIRIWNFHTGLLLNKIEVKSQILYGICLWDNEFLFVGCFDNTIKLINLKNGEIIKELSGHKNSIITIKKVNIPKYGECLISKGNKNDQYKLWVYFSKFNCKKNNTI